MCYLSVSSAGCVVFQELIELIISEVDSQWSLSWVAPVANLFLPTLRARFTFFFLAIYHFIVKGIVSWARWLFANNWLIQLVVWNHFSTRLYLNASSTFSMNRHLSNNGQFNAKEKQLWRLSILLVFAFDYINICKTLHVHHQL